MLPTLTKNPKLFAKSRLVEAAETGGWRSPPGAIPRPPLVQDGEIKMKLLMTITLAATLAAPAAAVATGPQRRSP
jgi:hypothetical protein